MTWDDETNQALEDDLRTILRSQRCEGTKGSPPGVSLPVFF